MDRGFWDKLPQPFWVLAPMYDVTDVAFRQTVIQCGRPHVFFTEFVSSDGLTSVGKERLMHHLALEKNEHPIVAQLFGANPEKFNKAASLAEKLGFSGIDLNTGCPDKSMMKQGSCAALYKTPNLAKEILLAMKQGAPSIPTSVKIRIGDNKIDWEHWIGTLLEAKPAAISIHLRTRKEMSKVPAHWEELPKIVSFIHAQTNPETRPRIVGNGDITGLREARQRVTESGCDGIMIGRGIFHNPWIFNESVDPESISPSDKAKVLIDHAERFEKRFGNTKRFDVLKRFFKIYIWGFESAAQIREELYASTTVSEAKTILQKHNLI